MSQEAEISSLLRAYGTKFGHGVLFSLQRRSRLELRKIILNYRLIPNALDFTAVRLREEAETLWRIWSRKKASQIEGARYKS